MPAGGICQHAPQYDLTKRLLDVSPPIDARRSTDALQFPNLCDGELDTAPARRAASNVLEILLLQYQTIEIRQPRRSRETLRGQDVAVLPQHLDLAHPGGRPVVGHVAVNRNCGERGNLVTGAFEQHDHRSAAAEILPIERTQDGSWLKEDERIRIDPRYAHRLKRYQHDAEENPHRPSKASWPSRMSLTGPTA